MAEEHGIDRRGFIKSAGTGLGAGSLLLAMGDAPAAAQTGRKPLGEKEKLERIASNTWPLRQLFKSRPGAPVNPRTAEMKQKYGEITMLDMPQFTKDTFPGVRHMDLFNGLFGDVTDDSMYSAAGPSGRGREFDPATPSGRKWLDTLASTMAKTGTACQHISNNAPRNLSDMDPELRKAGIAVAKKWLDAGKVIGAKSMRVNSGGPRIAPSAVATENYPKADELAGYLANCIESMKELADYGGKVGVKVTLENHWGLTANPMNIRIVLDEVNHPFCEASPDFCNWEHEYMLYNGLKALAPYAHTVVHAKYWDRWKNNDVQRSTRIMMDAGFEGKFALEYEAGPWDGVEGCKHLYREVLAAL
jgi:sugar phosphate isomerase/epimerase